MKLSNEEMSQRSDQQIAQYADVEDMHSALGEIHEYWRAKHFSARFREGTGALNHLDLYARPIMEEFFRSGQCRILSLGSGTGDLEIQIAKYAESLGLENYEFQLVDLSPIQNERAQNKIEAANLRGRFQVIEGDLNHWQAQDQYDVVIAHHSLHHIVELEHLFEQVLMSIGRDGAFVSFDMIGRNGHLRWPETYKVVNSLWHFLPEEKRRHRVLHWCEQDYRDHDCSTQGFEGIRSQDILPEILRRFDFETFYAWGGIIEVFTARAYGPNFDANSDADRKFIDFVDELNENLIDLGTIKPTIFCGVMRAKPTELRHCYKGRTPALMLRDPLL